MPQPTNQPLFPLLSILRAACPLYCNKRNRAVKKVMVARLQVAVPLNSRGLDCAALCPLAQTFAWPARYPCYWQWLYPVIALMALGLPRIILALQIFPLPLPFHAPTADGPYRFCVTGSNAVSLPQLYPQHHRLLRYSRFRQAPPRCSRAGRRVTPIDPLQTLHRATRLTHRGHVSVFLLFLLFCF